MKTYDISTQKPSWLKSKIPKGQEYNSVRKKLREYGLYTVCEEAKCPNLSECWQQKTATIMILGDTCTRACKFCHVKTGNPKGLVNPEEIMNSSKMVELMDLNYVVITSVDRDDIEDHGSGHFAAVVNQIKHDHPKTKIEVLIPDFDANPRYMHRLAKSDPFVIAQNIETVKRLTHPVRDPRAGYQKTLDCLDFYKKRYPHITTKTSLMVGLGETMLELKETMDDLRAINVDIVTFGQYMQPSKKHLSVEKYYSPDEFDELKRLAYRMGFKFVASGPMVRSSYKAADYLEYLKSQGHDVA